MPQSFAHISSCSKSACSFWWSFAVLIVLYSKQSSANNLIEDVTLSGRSFMWQRNSIGSSTVPWGTPESTVVSFDFSPSVRIDSLRKFVSHLWILLFIPYWCNLWRSLLCGTVSKAFEKSNIATSNWCPLSCSCRKSFIVVRSCVSQE